MTKPIRTITYKRNVYFNRADLIEYLREFAGSEETDTRNLMQALIDALNSPVPFEGTLCIP